MFRYISQLSRCTLRHLHQYTENWTGIASLNWIYHTNNCNMSSDGASSHRNRLADEKSPYLLQHASNPVDWYPWGNEAIEKAKKENKPIFLSVGYSTCHWCHVMERESFENETIGKLMNKHFVCIKVDREERPDVDKVYMSFIQATSGHGGWPMSVWLTPDLKPIMGGTYFPPDDRYYGQAGFKTVLLRIAETWQSERHQIEERGREILAALQKAEKLPSADDQVLPGQEASDRCFQQMARSYDKVMGGFGSQPKFPQPVNFNFLFRLSAERPDAKEGQASLVMCTHTLRQMAKGGMYDHISKGFHRYSTDNEWHVPHFEKMLYDQAQLAVSYIDAYQITGDKEFADVACEILEYVNRDLSSKEGGFFSAEDADSLPTASSKEKKEGAFCVWKHEEVYKLLPQAVPDKEGVTYADVFVHHYGVEKEGNVDPFKDPHDELKHQNVLIVHGGLTETAEKFGQSEEAISSLLRDCRQILYDYRQQRPRPHLDDKMVTAWNGLMITGFARAGQALSEPSYIERATKAADFLHQHAYNETSGTLLRTVYNGPQGKAVQIASPIAGFCDDYAFLIRGLLDLYEASLSPRWLEWAAQLQTTQLQLFWDQKDAGFYQDSGKDESIVLRMKEDQDGAEPCANSASALNLLRLADFLDKDEWRDYAVKLLMVFGDRLSKIPIALPEMMCGLMYLQAKSKQIVISGDLQDKNTQSLIKCVHSQFLPNKVLLHHHGNPPGILSKRLEVMTTSSQEGNAPAAYVCASHTCSLPVTSVEELEKLLAE